MTPAPKTGPLQRPHDAPSALEGLSDAQLLVIALEDGFSGPRNDRLRLYQSLLDSHGSLHALLSAAHPAGGHQDPPCHPKRLAAIRQLHLRLCAQELSGPDDPVDTTERAAALFLPRLGALQEETLLVLPATYDLIPLPLHTVAVGQHNTVRATPSQVLRPAVQANAPTIFLAHNHPNGSTEPSSHDWSFTRRMIEAARLLDITLTDHIIIAGNSYRSMRQQDGAPFGDAPDRESQRSSNP